MADVYPKKWDVSTIDNISFGGVKFTSSEALELHNKIILLQIRIPQLAPRRLKVEALVLSVKLRLNSKIYDIRAKFINVSEGNKKDFSILEDIIKLQDTKNAKRLK